MRARLVVLCLGLGAIVGAIAAVPAGATATPGTIRTIAGNGTADFCGNDGAAKQACLNDPQGVAVDRFHNVFIADNHNQMIRKVDRSGVITTFAGSGNQGYCGDGGPAVSACLSDPVGVATDTRGDVFIDDEGNNVIREVDTTGTISTVAGKFARRPRHCIYDRAATQACIFPTGIAVFEGDLYIADYSGEHVWKVHHGRISNFAGNGTSGHCGDAGLATQACLGLPEAVGTDPAGNVYITEYGNHDVRKVDTSGTITTFAGTGNYPPCGGGNDLGDGGPAIDACMYFPDSVAADAAGNVYIADDVRVRQIAPTGIINTVAGGGSGTFCGDGGPATSACFSLILSVTLDHAGNLDIADSGTNNRIRQVVAPFGP
jgi:hypothetical protein